MNMDGLTHTTPQRHNRYTRGVRARKVYAAVGLSSLTPRWFRPIQDAILLNVEPAERNADSWYSTPKAVLV